MKVQKKYKKEQMVGTIEEPSVALRLFKLVNRGLSFFNFILGIGTLYIKHRGGSTWLGSYTISYTMKKLKNLSTV